MMPPTSDKQDDNTLDLGRAARHGMALPRTHGMSEHIGDLLRRVAILNERHATTSAPSENLGDCSCGGGYPCCDPSTAHTCHGHNGVDCWDEDCETCHDCTAGACHLAPLEADADRSCNRPPAGWFCNLSADHDGPCPTLPRWWNLRGARWSKRAPR